MIIGVLILLAGTILTLLTTLFSAFNFIIPPALTNSVSYFVGSLGSFAYILPIQNIMRAVGFYLTVLSGFYLIKLIQWVLGHIPWFNVPQHLPNAGLKQKWDEKNQMTYLGK